MINEDFEKFTEIQQKHQGKYLGGSGRRQPESNDPGYNNQEITDKAIGATGRKLE